ncbi:MAG: amidohydrolase [Phycisphaerae bacterium]|nr:amidohydrolase [Saprospiraceae bacterium]
MRISIVQSSLHWENPEANREMLAQKLAPLRGHTDLVILPEMFTTGFSMNTESLAEPMNGPTMDWLGDISRDLNAAVSGSFICVEEGKCFNRLIFMRPDGQFDFYDKKHLFTLTMENQHFVAGKKRLTVEWLGWRICPFICYDLRFPAWSRNNSPTSNGPTSNVPYDILIYVANWPNRRAHHWRSLLTARAIENQSFVVGVNRTGSDGNGFEYSGDSAIIDYSGQSLAQISDGKEDVVTVEISLEDLHAYRRQLPFLADADAFEIKI